MISTQDSGLLNLGLELGSNKSLELGPYGFIYAIVGSNPSESAPLDANSLTGCEETSLFAIDPTDGTDKCLLKTEGVSNSLRGLPIFADKNFMLIHSGHVIGPVGNNQFYAFNIIDSADPNDDIFTVRSPEVSAIIPGQSVANLRIGSSTSTIRQTMGTPTTTHSLNDGLVEDYWPLSQPPTNYASQYIEVIYHNSKTIEIEEANPKFSMEDGLSIGSTFSQIGQKLKGLQCNKFDFDDATGYFYSDIGKGISFFVTAQDDVLPSDTPQVIIVTSPNQMPLPVSSYGMVGKPDPTPLQKDEFGYASS